MLLGVNKNRVRPKRKMMIPETKQAASYTCEPGILGQDPVNVNEAAIQRIDSAAER